MAEEKQVKDNRLRYLTAIGVAVTLVIYLYLPAYFRFNDLRAELTETTLEARETAEEVGKLRTEKKALEEDPLYLEKVIRNDLRMVRPGEVTNP